MKYLNETGVNKLITLIKTALKGKAEANHNHANYVKYNSNTTIEATPKVNADTLEGHATSYFVPKSGGTMTGALVAQAGTNYTTAQMRNIIISTADPSGGNNGDIWLKYEV